MSINSKRRKPASGILVNLIVLKKESSGRLFRILWKGGGETRNRERKIPCQKGFGKEEMIGYVARGRRLRRPKVISERLRVWTA